MGGERVEASASGWSGVESGWCRRLVFAMTSSSLIQPARYMLHGMVHTVARLVRYGIGEVRSRAGQQEGGAPV